MYNEGQEYTIKYVNGDGEEKETKIIPEKDMNKPQMIKKLQKEDSNFFKLLESKIVKESVGMKLFDVLENKNFEDVDIGDNTYDMLVAFCLDIEDADKDDTQEFLSKMAKQLDVVNDNGNTVVCDITKWVKENYDILNDIFDLSGTDEEENIEELVDTVVPGLVSGYVSETVYKMLNKGIKEECVTVEDEPLMEDVDQEEYPIEFNGIKRKVYNKDGLEQWETIEREIKYLEKYVKGIFLGVGNDSMEVTFGDPNKGWDETMFKVAFDKNLFGKIERVETTYSNTEVNEAFVYLANELYNLSK